ncbi:MAG TPA: tRNA (adenosine(37)-N6)-dimethylallyltransferase MiaA [Candidatus Polarisedimenticolia bacterium]|nr:tRNA (adenosine(37)-N6)-dimethylallyltransferase MiaA [Candidatus Polarisedimenticolia bacterium]
MSNPVGAVPAQGPDRLLVIVGPTAVGKSELAIAACERFAGEVVGVDSMQVYTGLDRGTAKPGPDVRRRVPHHGIDLADPRRDFSLGDFVRAGGLAIESIRRRGRLPVLVGGTGLYLRGLLKGIVAAPRRDEAIRARLRDLAERRGTPHLHRLLRRVDRQAAARLPPGDRQRLVRALEVFFASRRGLSDWIGESPFGPDRYASVKIGLSMDRAALYRVIDARVERFFAAGLVEEVRGLLEAACPETANAFKAIGYHEALRHLRGEIGLEEAIALTQRSTRRYAKRQWTWFRKEEGVTWFTVDPADPDRFRPPLAHAARALGRG